VKADGLDRRTIELCDRSSVDSFGWPQPETDRQRLLKTLLLTQSMFGVFRCLCQAPVAAQTGGLEGPGLIT